jgi:hypothetical protein
LRAHHEDCRQAVVLQGTSGCQNGTSKVATSEAFGRSTETTGRRRMSTARKSAGYSRRSRRRFVSNSANAPSLSRKHFPAAVLGSIGCWVASKEAPWASPWAPRRRDVKRDAVSERIAEVHEAVEPVLSCGEVGLKFLGQLVMHLRFAQAHMLALKLGAVAVLDVFLMDPNPRDVVDATERIHREGLNGNRRVHHDIALGDRFLIGRQ